MTPLDSALGVRPGIEVAAFFVTWIAIALLAVIAVHLHLRVLRLERASAPVGRPSAYARLIGQRMDGVLAGAARSWPRALVFVSASCPSCERVLDELRQSRWSTPITVLYVGRPAAAASWPANVDVVPDGAEVAAALGIDATPFLVVVSERGAISEAAPINSLDTLRKVDSRITAAPLTGMSGALEEVAR